MLNTPANERDPYLDNMLKKFPYVNGEIFKSTLNTITRFAGGIITLALKILHNVIFTVIIFTKNFIILAH